VYQNLGAGDSFSTTVLNFCPVGHLTQPYLAATPARDATGFPIDQSGSDLDQLVGTDVTGLFLGTNMALIDEEIIAWRTITLGGTTYQIGDVLRGQLNTVPADHQAGALVWFFTAGNGMTQNGPYGSDLNVQAKFLPTNRSGQLPIAQAPQLTLQTRSRYLRPYPPGNLRIGVFAWGVIPPTVTSDLTFTWSARNRLTQTMMVRQDDGDVPGGGEAGQTYTVVIQIAGVTKHTIPGVGFSYTYTAAQRGIDDPDFTKPVTIQIFSNARMLDSYFAQTFTTVMSGDSGTLGPGRYEFGKVTVGGILV
jgi:hypothetical protein